MGSGVTSDHHHPVAYAEAEAPTPADGQFGVVWASSGRTVTVSGPCPACGGRTATEFSPGIGGTKGFTGRVPQPVSLPSPVTIYCECGHAHADRPPDALDKGCGRFWDVFLPDEARQPPSSAAVRTSALGAPPTSAAP